MIAKLLALRKDAFLSQTFLVTLITLGAFASNYLYQVFLGRALGPADFGLYGSLFAIVYVIASAANSVQTAAARFSSQLQAEAAEGPLLYLFRKLLLHLALMALVVFVLLALLSSTIAAFLHTRAVYPLIAAVAVLLSVVVPVPIGMLQGLQRFQAFGLGLALNYTAKLILGAILVMLGFGVAGALTGVALGFAVGIMAALVATRQMLSKPATGSAFAMGRFYSYLPPAVLVALCLAAPSTLDVFIAKHFLPDVQVGYYTAAAVLGRIVLYLPIAVVYVLFPKISESRAQGHATAHLLTKGLLATAFLGGGVALLYLLFPGFIMGIVFGESYLPAAPLLRIYGIAMVLFDLSLLCAYYNLAVDNLRYAYLFAAFIVAQTVMLLVFHSSPLSLAWVLAGTNAPWFMVSLWYAVAVKERRLETPQVPVGLRGGTP